MGNSCMLDCPAGAGFVALDCPAGSGSVALDCPAELKPEVVAVVEKQAVLTFPPSHEFRRSARTAIETEARVARYLVAHLNNLYDLDGCPRELDLTNPLDRVCGRFINGEKVCIPDLDLGRERNLSYFKASLVAAVLPPLIVLAAGGDFSSVFMMASCWSLWPCIVAIVTGARALDPYRKVERQSARKELLDRMLEFVKSLPPKEYYELVRIALPDSPESCLVRPASPPGSSPGDYLVRPAPPGPGGSDPNALVRSADKPK